MSVPFIINIMSSDRVGIIADATTTIHRLKGNLDELSQTVLKGYFTMILLAHFPDGTKAEDIRAAFAGVENLSQCIIGILPYTETPATENRPTEPYIVTASGPDKEGLVSAVTEYLRLKGINITDFTSRTDNGVYTMMLMIALPDGTDVGKLQRSLQIAVEEHHLVIGIRHQRIFSKVNDI